MVVGEHAAQARAMRLQVERMGMRKPVGHRGYWCGKPRSRANQAGDYTSRDEFRHRANMREPFPTANTRQSPCPIDPYPRIQGTIGPVGRFRLGWSALRAET